MCVIFCIFKCQRVEFISPTNTNDRLVVGLDALTALLEYFDYLGDQKLVKSSP